MAKKLFGTDGVRGIANLEPMTAETALKLGRAIAHLTLIHPNKRHRILVGKDTRLSCYMLETAYLQGFAPWGWMCSWWGPCPPGNSLSHHEHEMRCRSGNLSVA